MKSNTATLDHRVAHRPAHDPTGPHVEDDGDELLAEPRWEPFVMDNKVENLRLRVRV